MKMKRRVSTSSEVSRAEEAGVWLVHFEPAFGAGTSCRVHLLRLDEQCVIGSGWNADFVIRDRFLSRRHLRLVRKNGALFVEDLGSTNGTFVNGIPVLGRTRLSLPAVLRAGLKEFSLFDAVETRDGTAVAFGRVSQESATPEFPL